MFGCRRACARPGDGRRGRGATAAAPRRSSPRPRPGSASPAREQTAPPRRHPARNVRRSTRIAPVHAVHARASILGPVLVLGLGIARAGPAAGPAGAHLHAGDVRQLSPARGAGDRLAAAGQPRRLAATRRSASSAFLPRLGDISVVGSASGTHGAPARLLARRRRQLPAGAAPAPASA